MSQTTRPVNFTLSATAIAQIRAIQREYDLHPPDDPAVMPGVSLGWAVDGEGNNGPESVTIGFWRASEFPEAAKAAVQHVSGIDLVFPVPMRDHAKFLGKVIDYAPERAFFLRPPRQGE